jgi:glycosyltransferase involved in cell wall biosynthesis
MVTSAHDVADARLHRLVAAMSRAGLTVEVLGLGDQDGAPSAHRVRTFVRRGPVGRACLAAALPWHARGRVLVALDPDVLVASRIAARARRRRIVADVHEDYVRLLRDRAWARGVIGRIAVGLVRVATRAAAGADLTVVADDHVPPRCARQRTVVRNEPDLAMLPEPGVPDESPRAVYVGDVRASRGLRSMLDALVAAPAWRLDVVGPVAPADRVWLRTRLDAEPALAARVTLHGRLGPEQAWRVAAGAWAGMCLLEPTPAFIDAVPSKLYEYLAAGVVPIVTDLPRQRALVEQFGVGRVVPFGPTAGAAAGEVLRALEADPSPLQMARDCARDLLAARRSHSNDYDVLAQRLAVLSRG